jgi:catechol 2,3-dioxygenase-like lactoylglutathione lyase family enzyme
VSSPLSVLAVELIVDDLDRAIELFTDVVGCELIARGPSTSIVGEVASIDAGSIVINLIQPASTGDGTILGDRTPRTSQIIFGSADDDVRDAARERAVEAGLSVMRLGGHHFHLTPESVKGALGLSTAIVVASIDGR